MPETRPREACPGGVPGEIRRRGPIPRGPPARWLASGIPEQLEDHVRVVAGRHVADQAEAELAREEKVPAPLHGPALGGHGTVEVHGLCQRERSRRLIQPEEPSGLLAA